MKKGYLPFVIGIEICVVVGSFRLSGEIFTGVVESQLTDGMLDPLFPELSDTGTTFEAIIDCLYGTYMNSQSYHPLYRLKFVSAPPVPST